MYLSIHNLQEELNISPSIFFLKHSIIINNRCMSYELKLFTSALCNFSHLLLQKPFDYNKSISKINNKQILLQNIYNNLTKSLKNSFLNFPIITKTIYCGNICQKSFTLLSSKSYLPWSLINLIWIRHKQCNFNSVIQFVWRQVHYICLITSINW